MTGEAGSLAEALAGLQADLPAVAKDKTAKVAGRDGKQGYSYGYADLLAVTEKLMPKLAPLGLSFTAAPTLREDGRFVLRYELLHTSGESTGGDYPLPERGSPQDVGSAITYARRYALCSVTGLATGGDDDDGAAATRAHRDAAAPPAGNGQERQAAGPDGAGTPQAQKPSEAVVDAWLQEFTTRMANAPDKQSLRVMYAEVLGKVSSGWIPAHEGTALMQSLQDVAGRLDEQAGTPVGEHSA